MANESDAGMTLHVSYHAIQRYQERIANVTDDEARAVLSTPAIQAAAKFGAMFVRLGTGHRIAIQNMTVVTVLPPESYKRQIGRKGLRKFVHSPRGKSYAT